MSETTSWLLAEADRWTNAYWRLQLFFEGVWTIEVIGKLAIPYDNDFYLKPEAVFNSKRPLTEFLSMAFSQAITTRHENFPVIKPLQTHPNILLQAESLRRLVRSPLYRHMRQQVQACS